LAGGGEAAKGLCAGTGKSNCTKPKREKNTPRRKKIYNNVGGSGKFGRNGRGKKGLKEKKQQDKSRSTSFNT